MTAYTGTYAWSALGHFDVIFHRATKYVVTCSWRAVSECSVTPRKMGISDPLVERPGVEVWFTTTPTGSPYLHTGSTEYPTAATHTPLNTNITFQAFVRYDGTRRASVEYRWNFGDGRFGYGSLTSHIYTVPNPNVQASLRVKDDLGRSFYSRVQIYLGP